AETSLTVPGILSVVDPGTARISRYSHRTKVQRLPIEAVSQASANQRAGRCGRVAPGTCIRLYSESDFRSRPEFTEPEIVRTNLASVILQMSALGLGDVARFADRESDFLSYLRLWDYVAERQEALSSNQFRKLCKAEFLNFLRIREWQDIHGQLRQAMRDRDVSRIDDDQKRRKAIHLSLLA